MLDLKAEYEYMKDDIDRALRNCLEHQKWILGPEVKELEERIAGYIGVKHCIGISSGTEALVLSLRALAIKTKGQEYFTTEDEIITTPFTFTATGDAILRSGATPVFVDIDPATYNIDPVKVREYLTKNLELRTDNSTRVVGLLPVHLYGQSCDMDAIGQLAEKHNLFVVEDVAQAFGGRWKNRKLGSIGHAGAFSFFPSKNLGGFGDGGMVSTNDNEIAEIVRMLLKHGGKDKYNVDHIGYNARLDTLQAAVLLAKFKYIDEFNERRRKIAGLYDKGLKGINGLTLPVNCEQSTVSNLCHVYHQYTVSTARRDELHSYLKDKGISTMVYYPFPLHKMKVFGNGRSRIVGTLSHSERASQTVLSLPVEPLQREEETSYIVSCVRDFFSCG